MDREHEEEIDAGTGRTKALRQPEDRIGLNRPGLPGKPPGSEALVSCIMPTYNRRPFIPLAIRYFLRQDYPNKELIVIDDGTDEIRDLLPEDERIRYHRLSTKTTLGAKLNMACEMARGRIIAHWDDDDWYAPYRLSYQVGALDSGSAELCGINKLLYLDVRNGDAYQYVYPADQRLWLLGSILCYAKDLWTRHRFAEIDVGMDGLFVWATPPEKITVLQDTEFAVFTIHDHNVSPKKTQGPWWQRCSDQDVRRVLGSDWHFYAPGPAGAITASCREAAPHRGASAPSAPPARNVYACLVHESQECVIDLIRNLRYHDRSSAILLYNGSTDPHLLDNGFPLAKYDVIVLPSPHPMQWGKLHHFALDCMQFARDHLSFDTLTIVDSDQLAVRSGLSHRLGAALAEHPHVGMFGNAPQPQGSTTRVALAVRAWQEIDLWRPFLKRFADGESKFVQWTFWPSTVFTAAAIHELTAFFAQDEMLQEILRRSHLWAIEEIVLPTVTALLGYGIVGSPCSYEFVKYGATYTSAQLDTAFARDDVFWIHPVPRQYGHPLRQRIRDRFDHYVPDSGPVRSATERQVSGDSPLLLTLPVLRAMEKVEGWLTAEEADLLMAATRAALMELPPPQTLVEIGSYCGRSTVVLGSVVKALGAEARVFAIDPHDGQIGSLDQGVQKVASSLAVFRQNMHRAGLQDLVESISSRAPDVLWDRPIHLLVIDGLHDYYNVTRDFCHFEPWVVPGGYIAFHDYADYYPGVKASVNETLGTGSYASVSLAGSLCVVKKLPAEHSVSDAATVPLGATEERS